jgi:GH25 family lysozyme M1 (1,4-beta-N-acetylmuramidase)
MLHPYATLGIPNDPATPMPSMPRPFRRHGTSVAPSSLLVALLLAVLSIGALPLAAYAADPEPYTEGIDISHWQGEIDWTQVAGADKAFAMMKATEDTDYIDPTYGINRARAVAAGLIVGAYHYAQPSTVAGSATAQADHFVDVAGFATGDLPPMLDLEGPNDLSDAQMEAWIREFLERVYERTGVRGQVYTSPSWWSREVGDTAWFATNGYRVITVAHWTTAPAPTVPAGDWAGFGWTFWQYTSNGSVPGIAGRVDLDRYNGTDFSGVLIDPLDEENGSGIPKPPFKDISSSKFEDDIAWLFAEGITTGCSATAYCPNVKVSRGQMATFLARALNLPKTSKDYFKDDEGSSHEQAINRLAKAGLTKGCATDRYCPNSSVTRAQLASFLAHVLDLSKSPKDYFRDDERSSHESNINRIARAGLTTGCAPKLYCPDSILTRGQMAAFLHRTFGY